MAVFYMLNISTYGSGFNVILNIGFVILYIHIYKSTYKTQSDVVVKASG